MNLEELLSPRYIVENLWFGCKLKEGNILHPFKSEGRLEWYYDLDDNPHDGTPYYHPESELLIK